MTTTTTPFIATLTSEWTKLRTLRTTWVTLGVGVVLAVGITALLAIVTGTTWDDWSAADRESFEPTLLALGGTFFSSIAFALLGVSAAASEYSSGMMRLTLTATPRRGRVLAAKVVVVAALTLVAGAIATLATFLLGQAILGSYGLETESLTESAVARALVGGSLLTPVLPAIAIALAVMLRSKAGAITAVLALIFAPMIFGGLLPSSWKDDVLIYLPGAAGDGLTVAPLEDGGSYLAPGVAVAVIAAWLAAFLGSAHLALTRRDA
jgi:ABC-2 type transport system permease protein